MSRKEEPKRLAPTRDTVRELYLKSGNRCAFPGCNKALFNANGVFVGQICHIEAAEPGGERFNPTQTNEQRRSASNLLLMCYDHHVQTDNVNLFPVERIKRIKEDHEKKFSDVIGSMLSSVVDHTTLTEPVKAVTLARLNQVLGWRLGPKEMAVSVTDMAEEADRLAGIPNPVRDLFLIMVSRGKMGRYGAELEVTWPEIQQVTGLATRELRDYLSTLDRYQLILENGTDDLGVQLIAVRNHKTGWPIWANIKEFCALQGVSLSQVIVNLDFSVLD